MSHILFYLSFFIYIYLFISFFVFYLIVQVFCPFVHMAVYNWSKSVLLSFLYQRPIRGILVITMYQRNPQMRVYK